jgi:hypothetical protein
MFLRMDQGKCPERATLLRRAIVTGATRKNARV